MGEPSPAAASRGARGLPLWKAGIAALCVAGAALVVALPSSRRPSPDPSLPPAPSPEPMVPDSVPPGPAAPPRSTARPPPAFDGEDDDEDDVDPEYPVFALADPGSEEIVMDAPLAPRAALSSEPLVPPEVVIDAPLAPRAPLSTAPLVPIEVRADGESAPRGPVSTAPLVPPVLVDPPDPPAPAPP